ncbi:Crp/Fnr family transcriptional regulator [Caproiciproducens sp. NJN-50]|uniref:Crp/Fnr family transcriptional regulator n=1 Tax=Acutalibacteraceae TaxID=3082771 RepID=UPI000FFE2B5A|nr:MULTISPECIES: Crp/Fnr family transcriptional regulator [Acutalibacteraceae]QAT50100.1 Crp/Fnr family transcriptional regulator [Caproiciproducens sp. NJN-50]
MLYELRKSPLFTGMSESDVEKCLSCSKSEIVTYEKDEIIFSQKDIPKKLFVLLEGTVAVCHDSVSGKRSIMANFSRSGELFGEVFLFLEKKGYDHYAQAVTPAKVLQIPREFLSHTCGENCGCHSKMISNMMAILAQKAYQLNQKVQILSCASLRQKIAKIFLQNCSAAGRVTLSMNREELADFLNTARPSLSRELMRMQEDGLLKIEKKKIYITNLEKLQNI